MSRRRRLTIVRVGYIGVAREAMEDLAERLADHLHLEVDVRAGAFLADAALDDRDGRPRQEPAGGAQSDASDLPRVSSNEVVDTLAARFPDDDGRWVLAVTAHDLTAPGRSYVFGEAALGGRWAVVSLARLGPPGATSPRLLERLFKEAVHELGHLAGLDHCPGSESCAMKASTSVSAIDARDSEFCPRCRAEFIGNQVEG